MLNALLMARNISTNGIKTSLHAIERIRQLMMTIAQQLNFRVRLTLFGDARLQGCFQLTDQRFMLTRLAIELLPTQCGQLCF